MLFAYMRWVAARLFFGRPSRHTLPGGARIGDESLSSIIIPLKGVKTFEVFLPLMFEREAKLFGKHGLSFDASNQQVIIVPRSNRSLIGTMNEAKLLIQDSVYCDCDHVGVIDCESLEHSLNETPYSRIGYDTPDMRLQKMIMG